MVDSGSSLPPPDEDKGFENQRSGEFWRIVNVGGMGIGRLGARREKLEAPAGVCDSPIGDAAP